MGVIKDLADYLKSRKDLSDLAWDIEFEKINYDVQSVYLKRMALDICANFVAKAVSQSVFRTSDSQWFYKLNVRPNTDSGAAQFWEQFVYRLIVDNRVLAVLSDTDDLLIADTWSRNEYAVREDTFEGVTVKGYTFKRTFRMSEVLYLEYSSKKLSGFTDGLFKDYSDLYGRLVDAAKRNSQIRGSVSVEAGGGMNEDTQKQLQNYIDKLFQAFKDRSIAVVPMVKGFSYEEYSNKTGASQVKTDEIIKIQNELTDTVADAIGIPTALLHGNRAELKDNIKAFDKYCLAALLKKIEDELNAKITGQRGFERGGRIEVWGINRPNMFELAEPIDKLISSGTFNSNEIRGEMGYDPREGGDLYYTTKNYEDAAGNSGKGGEEE